MRVRARLEFKIQDCWVGVFWRRTIEEVVDVHPDDNQAVMVTSPRLDIWACVIPCLPVHVVLLGREERSDAMRYVGHKMLEEIARESKWEPLDSTE